MSDTIESKGSYVSARGRRKGGRNYMSSGGGAVKEVGTLP